jgi:hypothetical protein
MMLNANVPGILKMQLSCHHGIGFARLMSNMVNFYTHASFMKPSIACRGIAISECPKNESVPGWGVCKFCLSGIRRARE